MGKTKKRIKRKNNNRIKLLMLILIIIGIIFLVNGKKDNNENGMANGNKETKDSTSPEIFLDAEEAVVIAGDKYTPKATARDDVDGDLTSKITFSDFDTSKEGEYETTLSVTDNAGNKMEKKQKVIVRGELKNGLPILMYHFFYDDIKYFRQDSNWIKNSDFEEQVKYLKENDFYFPTWGEVNDYIDGKIKLPTKSVVLTVDDGDASFFDVAVPILQKYNIPATSFVITEWYGWRYDSNMKCVVWESHSESMHEAGANGKGRMVNWSYDKIVEDIKKSSETLGGANVFCYPFGHYNDTAIKALKATNYILALTVNEGRVTKNSDKYKLPRVRVVGGNSLNYFIKSVN